jgi:hypothetical protein
MYKTYAQRQAESAAREAEEYERQRSLPSLEDKIQAIGDAVVTLLATIKDGLALNAPIDPRKIDDIAGELLRVLNKETKAK